MATWHIVIQGRAHWVESTDEGRLRVGQGDRGLPLALSFDEAWANLERLPNLFFEPDGAFAWVGKAAEGNTWRLDGCLYDGGAQVQYVELKLESVPRETWDRLLEALGATTENSMVQVVRAGEFYSLPRFREEL